MQQKAMIPVLALVLTVSAGLAGWQAWSMHQMREELTALQQNIGSTGTAAIVPTPSQLQQPGSVSPPLAGSNLLNIDPSAPLGGSGDPFADFDRIRNEMMERMQQMMSGNLPGSLFDDDWFGFSAGGNFGPGGGLAAQQPQLNMTEGTDSYVITIPIPEHSNAEVSASVEGSALNIEGTITTQQDSSANGSTFTGTQSSQFARTMPLPPDADPDGLTNVTEDNQVVITIPKQA